MILSLETSTHPTAGGHVDEDVAAYGATCLLRTVVCEDGKHRCGQVQHRDQLGPGHVSNRRSYRHRPTSTYSHPKNQPTHAQEVLSSVSDLNSAIVRDPRTLTACTPDKYTQHIHWQAGYPHAQRPPREHLGVGDQGVWVLASGELSVPALLSPERRGHPRNACVQARSRAKTLRQTCTSIHYILLVNLRRIWGISMMRRASHLKLQRQLVLALAQPLGVVHCTGTVDWVVAESHHRAAGLLVNESAHSLFSSRGAGSSVSSAVSDSFSFCMLRTRCLCPRCVTILFARDELNGCAECASDWLTDPPKSKMGPDTAH